MENRNEVYMSGRIIQLEYTSRGAKKGFLEVKRNSGIMDRIPFITHKNIGADEEWVSFRGVLQTRNVRGKDGKSHKKIYIFVEEVYSNKNKEDRNEVEFTGTLVRKDVLRTTPKGKTIMDIVVAINDQYGSQYPSLVVWGSVAENVDCLEIGSVMDIQGRFQSREYEKQLGEISEIRTAYEISVRNAVVL